MKHYLENYQFYVMSDNDGKLVYKVGEFEVYSGYEAIQIHLELVAGWDGYSDTKGWYPADEFDEDVQMEIINQYFLKESMEEALEENGYTILRKIEHSLQTIIDKHNEA